MSQTNGTIERVSTKPITKAERAHQRGKQKELAYMNGELPVIAIDRAWIREHGWPSTYAEIGAAADAGELSVMRLMRVRQDLIRESYQSRTGPAAGGEWAYFREGAEGQAFLFAQAWDGAA
jgi:hypothetical protein